MFASFTVTQVSHTLTFPSTKKQEQVVVPMCACVCTCVHVCAPVHTCVGPLEQECS